MVQSESTVTRNAQVKEEDPTYTVFARIAQVKDFVHANYDVRADTDTEVRQ